MFLKNWSSLKQEWNSYCYWNLLTKRQRRHFTHTLTDILRRLLWFVLNSRKWLKLFLQYLIPVYIMKSYIVKAMLFSVFETVGRKSLGILCIILISSSGTFYNGTYWYSTWKCSTFIHFKVIFSHQDFSLNKIALKMWVCVNKGKKMMKAFDSNFGFESAVAIDFAFSSN